jgi:hypothetical protein
MRLISYARILSAAALVAAGALPALAGPPLVCHPLDIGTAHSLPWDTRADTWKGMRASYNRDALVGDTLALLTPATPVIVRMETLRRAAIYASDAPAVARDLLATMLDRAKAKGAEPLAVFDAGYLAETYRQMAAIAPALGPLVSDVQGYALLKKSLAQRGPDPAMEFAAALASSYGLDRNGEHLRAARAGAGSDALLAKNLQQIAN